MATASDRVCVTVAGCGAVTALGAGVSALDDLLRTGASGLKPAKFRLGPGQGSQRWVAGRVPEPALAEMRSMVPEADDDRTFLMAVWAARESDANAGRLFSQTPSQRRGMVVATTKASIEALERQVWKEPISRRTLERVQPGRLTRDVALSLGVAGPVRCVSAACISGLLALSQGAAMIVRGHADAVCVVGVDVLSAFVVSGFASLKSMDPEGCRPFDRNRVGLSLGEGAGAVILARDGGCGMRPRLTGWGSSNDANHLTGPSRDGSGLALAMTRSLQQAGRTPGEVDCVHAHGTGTPYNDAMESLAFRTVFADRLPPVSASKGSVGHTLGAAGVLESIVCVRALELGMLPGTPRLVALDPVAPSSMVQESRPAPDLKTVVKVNSGFGGTNAAVIFERNGA